MKRWYIIGAAIVVVLLIAGGAYWFWSQAAQAQFFADVLKTHRIVTDVSIGGETYTVNTGTVTKGGETITGRSALPALRLAYAITVAERRPILNLEGTLPLAMKNALDALEKTRDVITVAMKNIHPSYDTSSNEFIYPIQFLRKATDAEEARQQLLKERSAEAYSIYAHARRIALEEGVRSLKGYQQVATSLTEKETNLSKSYQTIVGTFSQERWLTSIGELVGDLEGALISSTKYEECARGMTDSCMPDAELRLPAIQDKLFAATTPSAAAVAQARTVVKLYNDTIGHGTPATPGLLYELSADSCTPLSSTGPALFGLGHQQIFPDDRLPYITYVSDLVLMPTAAYPEESVYGKYLESKNITSAPLSSTNHYVCPTNAADLAIALALRAVHESIKTTPMSAYVTGANKTALEALEALITEGAVVREKDVHDYLRTSIEAYESGYTFPAEALSLLISLANRYEMKTAGLPNYLWNVVSVNIRNLYASKQTPSLTQNTFEPLYFFMFQSGYFALHLGNNHSVSSHAQNPLSRTGEESAETTLYSKLPDAGITKASVLSDLRYFNSTLTDALEALQVPTAQ